jgi:hypothetical protein
MLLESRPHARRLLAVGLSRAAEAGLAKELSEPQRHAFSSDLIDVYFEDDSAEFRPELERAVTVLSGGDAGRLLSLGVENVNFGDLEVARRDKALINRALDDVERGRPMLSQEN